MYSSCDPGGDSEETEGGWSGREDVKKNKTEKKKVLRGEG